MYSLIIGAPFGNYIRCPGVTPTIGTYTLDKRAGLLKRFWKILSTVRYFPRLQSWVNALGLPNPGIRSLRGLPWEDHRQEILSIHGFNQWEWEKLIRVACVLDPLMVELNLSCPNVTKTAIQEAIEAAKFAHSVLGRKVIAKLAPIRWMDFARPLMDVGVNKFHLCNTIATPGGGFSGKALKQYSLWATEEVKQTWGDKVVVIGGGGISDTIDIDDYLNAGADHVSVASLLFNPLNWKLLAIFRDFINGRKEGTALGFIPS